MRALSNGAATRRVRLVKFERRGMFLSMGPLLAGLWREGMGLSRVGLQVRGSQGSLISHPKVSYQTPMSSSDALIAKLGRFLRQSDAGLSAWARAESARAAASHRGTAPGNLQQSGLLRGRREGSHVAMLREKKHSTPKRALAGPNSARGFDVRRQFLVLQAAFGP